MIIFLFLICLISLFLVSHWLISKIVKLNIRIKNITANTQYFKQEISDKLCKIKNNIINLSVKKSHKTNKTEIFLILLDSTLTLMYKKKYERLKDYYEFIKNTLA